MDKNVVVHEGWDPETLNEKEDVDGTHVSNVLRVTTESQNI